jgi:exopolysaccharide biosynthesis polyprenyl glycosylphosphotransferase
VGANEEGRALAQQILTDPGSGAQIIGFLDSSLPSGTPVVDGLAVLGDIWNLDNLINHFGVRQVIVATTAISRDELLDLYWNYGYNEPIDIRLSSGLAEILTTGVEVHEISRLPLVSPQRLRITGLEAWLKTALDYTIAATALVLLSPCLVLIGLIVKLDSRGPVLHRRRVLGVSGRSFDAFKFRTMVVDADLVLAASPDLRDIFERGYKLKKDPRVTRVGGFLRRTSLDELPQLVNVLRGEMSLVGPRMIAPEEAPRFGKWQRNLVTVKPGITGPWQVEGRSDLPYEQRVELSMEYIRNYTFWRDLLILARTIFVVFKGKGAY